MGGSDKELGGRTEGAQTSQQNRSGLGLCSVIMAATVSFVEHVCCLVC